MAQHPSDMRIGVNGMCGQVRSVGLDPSNGDVYIFVGKSRRVTKILHWERGLSFRMVIEKPLSFPWISSWVIMRAFS